MSDKDRSYRVGYGRPPKEHRWGKGYSGNPSGARKERRTSFNPRDGLDEEIPDDPGRRTFREAQYESMRKRALQGDLQLLERLICKFHEHGLLGSPRSWAAYGVVVLPECRTESEYDAMIRAWTEDQLKRAQMDHKPRLVR